MKKGFRPNKSEAFQFMSLNYQISFETTSSALTTTASMS